MGEPTGEIEDKEMYHLLDALRYSLTWLKPVQARTPPPTRRG
jgi:hypothetical protein